MQVTELIDSARFVVDSEGQKKAVLLDYEHWRELLARLEDFADLQEIGSRPPLWRGSHSLGAGQRGVEGARCRCETAGGAQCRDLNG